MATSYNAYLSTGHVLHWNNYAQNTLDEPRLDTSVEVRNTAQMPPSDKTLPHISRAIDARADFAVDTNGWDNIAMYGIGIDASTRYYDDVLGYDIDSNYTFISLIAREPSIFTIANDHATYKNLLSIFSLGNIVQARNKRIYFDGSMTDETFHPELLDTGDTYEAYNISTLSFNTNVDGKNIIKSTNQTILINDNLNVTGNVSMKRPYIILSDNTTQNISNSALAYMINFSTIEDNYLVTIDKQVNITVQQQGDYHFIISAIGYTTSGSNKHIDIWFRKNGIDIPRSNTKVELPTSGIETDIVVPYQIDLNYGDTITAMWASDTTTAQLLSISNQSNPTRPATPSIILTMFKTSEIT